MISSISSENSSVISYLLQAGQRSALGDQASSNGVAPGLSSGSSSSGDSADISGPGQLLSELQQLASQNPTEFKQITAQIATQLQTAASGDSSSPLANLASLFQTASQTGEASGLLPTLGGSPGNSGVGTYDVQGHLSPSTTSSADSPLNNSLQSLFQTISQEVSAALKT